MSHQKFLETIWAHRDRLKCSTVVVRAGARKWICAVCVTPHDVLSPKREQMRRWYRNRGRFQRIEWANSRLCINCGRSCSESASTRYCVKCHSGRLETQRRYRERKQHGITEALYGGRADFQREQIKPLVITDDIETIVNRKR